MGVVHFSWSGGTDASAKLYGPVILGDRTRDRAVQLVGLTTSLVVPNATLAGIYVSVLFSFGIGPMGLLSDDSVFKGSGTEIRATSPIGNVGVFGPLQGAVIPVDGRVAPGDSLYLRVKFNDTAPAIPMFFSAVVFGNQIDT